MFLFTVDPFCSYSVYSLKEFFHTILTIGATVLEGRNQVFLEFNGFQNASNICRTE
jgi:hypothetical protein